MKKRKEYLEPSFEEMRITTNLMSNIDLSNGENSAHIGDDSDTGDIG